MKQVLSHTVKRLSILLILLIATILFNQKGFAQLVTVTNPASPFTVPANVTSVKVEVWGAGGGGGSVNSGFGTNGGGGGGGGAYNVSTFTVIPGNSFTVSVGAGGTAGSGSAGGTGGTTTVSGTAGSVSADGGTGGGRGNGGNGASGAGATGFKNGGAGGASSGNGAGGGGGAGNNGDGGAGSNTTAGAAGAGNPNVVPYIGALGAAAKTSNGAGNNGTSPGGGGSGGRAGILQSNNGGTGGAGQVVITYCTTAFPGVTNSITYCQHTTALQLTASGTGLLWYSTETGGPAGIATAPTPSTSNTGTTDYYVSQTVGGCEGPRAHIIVTVNPTPTTTVTGQSDLNCFAAADGTITIQANGGTSPYLYSVNNGANYTPGATNPFTMTGLNANTAYKIRVKDNNGCESTLIP